MEIELLHYLIICPLVFLAGFVDAIAGGGGLISLPAYMLAGLPVHFAIATNKISSAMGTAAATFSYAGRGYVSWRFVPGCVLCAFIGSAMGANLALVIADNVFQAAMLVILPLTALYVMRCQGLSGRAVPQTAFGFGKTLLLAMLAAFLLGIYDGVYGPGTGTFLILLLMGMARLPLTEANGLTKVINLTTNIAALLVYILNGKVLLVLGLVAGLFNIAGSLLGTRCFVQGGGKIARPIILLVLAVFFIRVVYQMLSA